MAPMDVEHTPNVQAEGRTDWINWQINFSFFPGRITMDWVDRITVADQTHDVTLLLKTIETVMASWDLTWGEAPFPPTAENMRLIPLGLLLNILEEASNRNEQIRKGGGPKVPTIGRGWLSWLDRRASVSNWPEVLGGDLGANGANGK